MGASAYIAYEFAPPEGPRSAAANLPLDGVAELVGLDTEERHAAVVSMVEASVDMVEAGGLRPRPPDHLACNGGPEPARGSGPCHVVLGPLPGRCRAAGSRPRAPGPAGHERAHARREERHGSPQGAHEGQTRHQRRAHPDVSAGLHPPPSGHQPSIGKGSSMDGGESSTTQS